MSDELSRTEVETLIRKGTIESVNLKDTDEGEKYVTDEVTFYDTADTEGDLDDLTDATELFHAAFPDIEADITDLVYDRDRASVTFSYTVRGTHEGALDEIPPTGASMEANGIGYAELDGEQITEYHLVFDNFGMLQDLGVVG